MLPLIKLILGNSMSQAMAVELRPPSHSDRPKNAKNHRLNCLVLDNSENRVIERYFIFIITPFTETLMYFVNKLKTKRSNPDVRIFFFYNT